MLLISCKLKKGDCTGFVNIPLELERETNLIMSTSIASKSKRKTTLLMLCAKQISFKRGSVKSYCRTAFAFIHLVQTNSM